MRDDLRGDDSANVALACNNHRTRTYKTASRFIYKPFLVEGALYLMLEAFFQEFFPKVMEGKVSGYGFL
ncbi:MAG: hypothetical protein JO235_26160 [Chroococcidiopsidaceae cyanobacterium CP_BM_RX_35]|nr:hypothetical protein [Chroococcidiopsidaceae cyanobacterium CP_BM_RX_35]